MWEYIKKTINLIRHKLKGYRTAIVGAIVFALPILDYVLNTGMLVQVIKNPERAAVFTSVLGLIIVALRSITNTPFGESNPIDNTPTDEEMDVFNRAEVE